MNLESNRPVVYKYPVCDAGQQFIQACMRTAGRLELTAEERFMVHRNLNPASTLSVCKTTANVVPIRGGTPSRKQYEESQSA